jgi:CheY-like chemotaxis protein
MQMEMKEDELSRIYVQQILSSSERAANLVQSLLAFGRKQIISLKPVKINEIVKKVEKLLLRVIGEDIELKTILASEETTVMVDAAQIEQILMNLATNARDAMPEGGYLTLSTELVEMDEKYTNTHSFGKAGQYVLLSVEDTGIGMDEKTREKIFEPFFTTKEVGKGSGLGLSMVYGAIKQHNGYIDCYSEPDKGTVFKIYLPVMHGRVYPEEIPEAAPAPAGGSETVLIAEDNSNVRTLTKGVLEKFGYTVVEAVDGEDAIRVFKENREKINLLLLDVIMPKKNGKEVYEEIRKERPDIKSLFISGYTANIIHKKGLLEESLEFIPKPVSPNKLLRKVREVLDKDRD